MARADRGFRTLYFYRYDRTEIRRAVGVQDFLRPRPGTGPRSGHAPRRIASRGVRKACGQPDTARAHVPHRTRTALDVCFLRTAETERAAAPHQQEGPHVIQEWHGSH